MDEPAAKKKLFTGSYIFLILISFINAMGVSMIFTMIVDYAHHSLGASLGMSGLLTGSYAIAALLMRPFSGPAVDHFNNKYLCILATSANVLVMLGYSLAPNVPVMMAVRIVHGAAFGISSTANMALVSRFIPNDRMGEGLGYFGLGQVFALAFGPQLGVMFQEAYGYQALFRLIAAMTLGTVIMLLFFKYDHKKQAGHEQGTKFKLTLNRMIAKEAIVYAIVGSIFAFGNGITTAFMKVMCDQRQIAGYAMFFTVGAVTLFVVRLVIGRLADNKGLSLVVNLSLIVSVFAMVLIGFAQSLPVILIAAVLRAIGQGGGQISLQSACLKKVSAQRRGVAASTYFIGADIGQGIGPTAGGVIAATFAGANGAANYSATFLTAGVLLLSGILIFSIYQKRNKTAADPENLPETDAAAVSEADPS